MSESETIEVEQTEQGQAEQEFEQDDDTATVSEWEQELRGYADKRPGTPVARLIDALDANIVDGVELGRALTLAFHRAQCHDEKAAATKAAKDADTAEEEFYSGIMARLADEQRRQEEGDNDADRPLLAQAENAWRETPIAQAIALTPSQIDKLDDINIVTAGQFEDLRAGLITTHPSGLRDISGFGDATIDKLEDMFLDYLSSTRDANVFAGDVEDSEVSETENDEDEPSDELTEEESDVEA